MIEVSALTKQYDGNVVVDSLDFTVKPGIVTGFLGPNGAGKSTTMRMIVGLDNPTSGSATIDGKRYAEYEKPLHKVGTLLDAQWLHPHRSAANHLRMIATANGMSRKRVDEVLGIVGLSEVAGRKAGTFSLGMGQRLGLAAALLGDPEVLILDEPVNGLDPEGIRWVRGFVRHLASEGRTVLISSHLLSEMAQTADHLVVIGKGKLIADRSTQDFIASASETQTVVRTANPSELAEAFTQESVSFRTEADTRGRRTFLVDNVSSEQVGAIAHSHGVLLHELTERHASLEEAFMNITGQSVEYTGNTAASGGTPIAAHESAGTAELNTDATAVTVTTGDK
ncbi:ABC transporter ATP-binding protein [Corynebacterium anserum]|uniref:ATP-binding cassette domain-containing protein n=1 Tax=Corynebacterium anserum TaxID=2684406 RepID=A0A7G7YLZ0_9CORY|nr:ABC transporter ATP-binding protein [Corynebacterium anserum]MBC2681323.1 ATP-binding cassette domain-containing protein [Corynebacterium anserum]QNH95510.1 ATP-binding cassette domain-containing protein [Corynebacterium anserum]